jgi:ligand-binding sensor domain-containing protein
MARRERGCDRLAAGLCRLIGRGRLAVAAVLLGGLSSAPLAVTPEQAGFALERITVEHGLPDLRVYTISQDRDGMLWVGSRGGLFRYDGYRFDLIDDSRPHRFAERPLLSGSTGRVFVDSRNRVWAMSWGHGLNRLDLDSGRMLHFRPDPADPGSLSSPFAQIVFEDRDGTLWIGSGNGLNRFDEERAQFELIRAGPAPSEAMDEGRVWSLSQTDDGQLWIGTARGLFRYDPATPAQPPQPVAEDALGRQTVRAMHWDRRGRLWLATPTQFGRLDLADGRFHPLPLPDGADFGSVRVSQTWPARDDRLWLATEAGLLQVELEHGRYRSWADGSHRLLPGDDFRDVLVDRGGVVWLSSLEQGIVKLRETGDSMRLIDPAPADAVERHGYGQINAVLADRHGRVWLATPRGLLRGEPGSWRFERAAQLYRNAELGLPFLAIAEGAAGELWLAGIDGVRRFDPESGISEDFSAQMRALGAVDVRSNAVLQDRQGRVWIGSHRHGLFRLIDGQPMQRLRADPQRPYSLSSDQIGRLLEDRLGRLWVGTLTGGLNLIVPGDDRAIVYRRDASDDAAEDGATGSVAQAEISAIYHARDGDVWVGGPGGVDLLSLSTGVFTRVALPSLDGPMSVADFFEDDSGNVWAVMLDLIARLPADTPGASVRRFEDRAGRPFLFRTAAAARLADGTRLFGGHAGLLALRGENLVGEPPGVPTSIARVLLDNEEQRLGRGADGTPELRLDRGHGSLAIEFALADFRSPRLNRYRYRMRGLDGDYVSIGAERHVRFSHLPVGTYVFEVEGSGAEGVWSSEPARLRLRVLPPWWAEPRVLGGLLLLVALAAVIGFRLHLYRVGLRHAALQRTIDSRTQALLQQRTELEAIDRMVRAVHRQRSFETVLREALAQGLRVFPAGTRGAALLRSAAERRLQPLEMTGYTQAERDSRFDPGGVGPGQLLDQAEPLGPGVYLQRGRLQPTAASRPMPLASLLLTVEREQLLIAALVVDHYGSEHAFDQLDLAALQRFRQHLLVAADNASQLQQQVASVAQRQRIEDAAALGTLTAALAASLAEPVDSADAVAQEFEVGLARLERQPAAAPSDEAREQLRSLRRQLRRLLGAVAELRTVSRRLRQTGGTAPLESGRPVALLADAIERLREHRGAWLTIDYRFTLDPPMPCIAGAISFMLDTVLARFVGAPQGGGEPPHLQVAASVADGWLRIDLHDDRTVDPLAGPAGAGDLEFALASAVLDRHAGRLQQLDPAAGRHWRIELPLFAEPPPAAVAGQHSGRD